MKHSGSGRGTSRFPMIPGTHFESVQHDTTQSLPANQPDSAVAGFPSLEHAIRLIPTEKKSAYVQAKEQNPEIVDREAHPLVFLRKSNYNIPVAAERLCAYWQCRKQVFGQRYTMQMSQTGDGILRRIEVNVLRSGYCVVMPRQEGAPPCLFYDGSRLGKSSREARIRTMFYIYSVLSEEEVLQRVGFTVLAIIQPKANVQAILLDDLAIHLTDALPIKLDSIHFVCYPPSYETVKYFQDHRQELLLPSTMSPKTFVHLEPSTDGLLEKLKAFGFLDYTLPEKIGGRYVYSHHSDWCEERARLEWGLPTRRGILAEREETQPVLTEGAKVDRKRRMNVLHSRRKRERQKIEVDSLQQQCRDFQTKNLDLIRKNVRLEELIEEASNIVSQLTEEKKVASNSADSLSMNQRLYINGGGQSSRYATSGELNQSSPVLPQTQAEGFREAGVAIPSSHSYSVNQDTGGFSGSVQPLHSGTQLTAEQLQYLLLLKQQQTHPPDPSQSFITSTDFVNGLLQHVMNQPVLHAMNRDASNHRFPASWFSPTIGSNPTLHQFPRQVALTNNQSNSETDLIRALSHADHQLIQSLIAHLILSQQGQG